MPVRPKQSPHSFRGFYNLTPATEYNAPDPESLAGILMVVVEGHFPADRVMEET